MKDKTKKPSPKSEQIARENRALVEAAKQGIRIEVREVITFIPASIRREDGRVFVSVKG